MKFSPPVLLSRVRSSLEATAYGFGTFLFLMLATWSNAALGQPVIYNWSTSFGAPGVNGSVDEVLAHGDSLIIAGAFSEAGGTVAHNIAIFDRTERTWTALSTDIDVWPRALAIDDAGRIYVAGEFFAGTETSVRQIAAWDGTRWQVLREITEGAEVTALATHSGHLYAAISIPPVGASVAMRISVWNGTAWHDLPGDFTHSRSRADIYALALDQDSSLYVGGRFDRVGAVEATSLARWNGSQWEALGAGISSTDAFGTVVYALRWDGSQVLVGGDFTHAGSEPIRNLAAWDGQEWHPIGGGIPEGSVTDIDVAQDGTVYVTGSFSGHGTLAVLRESGWTFVKMPGIRFATSITAVEAGRVIAGSWAPILSDGNNLSQFLFAWEASTGTWHVLDDRANGLDGPVYTLLSDGEGGFYVGGCFDFAGTERANNVAHWNGTRWEALGEGLPRRVYSLVQAPDGTLYAGGSFIGSGNQTFRHVARWNGSTWEALGEGVSGEVRALAIAHGKLYVGGAFTVAGSIPSSHLAQWDLQKQTWELLAGTPDSAIATMIVDAQQRLYVGGHFQAISSETGFHNLAMWDGTTWHRLENGSAAPVTALALHGNILYASGRYDGYAVAAWDGEQWTPVGEADLGGDLRTLAILPDGKLFAGGELNGARDCISGHEVQVAELAFYDQDMWCAVEEAGIGGRVVSALLLQQDDLVIGGEFTFVGQMDTERGYFYGDGIPSSNLAVLHEANRVSTEGEEPGAVSDARLVIFPNPASGPVHLSYTMARTGPVEIRIWDVLGRLVSRRLIPIQHEGDHTFVMDAPRNSGTYVVEVQTPAHRIIRTLVIIHP